MKPKGFTLRWPCDAHTRSRSVTWYKIVEFNVAYKHGRYEKKKKNWLKSEYNVQP